MGLRSGLAIANFVIQGAYIDAFRDWLGGAMRTAIHEIWRGGERRVR